MIYALRLLQQLITANRNIDLVVSSAAQVVLRLENGLTLSSQPREMQRFFQEHLHAGQGQVRVYGRDQWSAPIASGSAANRAMVICPCTSGTLACDSQWQ